MILKTDLDARKRGLSELHHRLQLATEGTLNPAMVIGNVVALEKEARYALHGKASVEVKQ